MATSAEALPRSAAPPIAIAALLHLAAWAGLLALAASLPAAQAAAIPWPWAQGAVAVLLGCLARLPLWWLPINAFFFPALAAFLALELPSWLILVAFVALLSLNAAAWRERVPLLMSGRGAARRVAGLLPHRRGVRVIDLGCGTGTLLRALAAARPDAVYRGVEISPLPWLIGRWRAWRAGGAFAVRWGDFWLTDLSSYDVVYAYLSPQPMARLWAKARREMRPGSLLISNGFAVPGAEPALVVETGGYLSRALFVWRM